jgi:hypothetical protein
MSDVLVAGERAATLLEALLQIKMKRRRNGMMGFDAIFEPGLGLPLARALMRVEAELLLQDADSYGRPGTEVRTYEQRAAAAFVALTLRVTDAMGPPT